MSERDPLHSQPVTPDEVEAAERLARALDGRPEVDADPEALAMARLLQSLEVDGDELASRRLRTRLVAGAHAAGRRGVRAWRAWLAAGLVVGVLLGMLWQHRSVSSRELLFERERAASRAVAAVSAGWSVDAATSARLHTAFDEQWRARLTTTVEAERASALTSPNQAGASQARGSGTV